MAQPCLRARGVPSPSARHGPIQKTSQRFSAFSCAPCAPARDALFSFNDALSNLVDEVCIVEDPRRGAGGGHEAPHAADGKSVRYLGVRPLPPATCAARGAPRRAECGWQARRCPRAVRRRGTSRHHDPMGSPKTHRRRNPRRLRSSSDLRSRGRSKWPTRDARAPVGARQESSSCSQIEDDNERLESLSRVSTCSNLCRRS